MSDFTDLVDLAAERLGGAVLAANDEFFAPKENLLKAGRGGLERGRVHRRRQVDGRLGDPPPARARPRLVHRPARPAGRAPGRGRRHRSFPRQLSGILLARSLRRRGLSRRPRS